MSGNRQFNEQAYLIYHHLIKSGKDRKKSNIIPGRLKNNMTVHRVGGRYTPVDFINRVTKRNKLDLYKNLLDLETHKISSLVPYLELHRVIDDSYVPFYFPVAAERVTKESILQPGTGIDGVGIQSFGLNFTGKNPFSFDKEIECTLSIYVDNLENIFKTPPGGYASLADLFSITRNRYVSMSSGMKKEVSADQISRPSNYEVAATLGYSVPTNGGIFTEEETRAIQNTALSIRMTLINHNISVSQDGTAQITIDYIGRLASVTNENFYNILATKRELEILSGLQAEQEEEDSSLTQVQIAKKKKEREEKLKEESRNRFRKFFKYLDPHPKNPKNIEDLFKQSRIHNLHLDEYDIMEYEFYGEQNITKELKALETQREKLREESSKAKNAPKAELKSKKNEISELNTQIRNIKESKKLSKSNAADSYHIDYVFLGDYLESLLYNSKRNLSETIVEIHNSLINPDAKIKPLQQALKNLETFKVLFGSVTMKTGKTQAVTVNLADIPISLKLLQQYFFENVEQQYQTKYTIQRFLDDMVNIILPKAIQGHAYRDAPFLPDGVTIRSMSITGENSSKLSASNIDVDVDQLPDFLKRTRKKKKRDEIDYYVVYAQSSKKDSTGLSGNVKKDSQNGIYHFHLGKNKGMLKSIDFSQSSVPYRKEALIVESVSLYDELKMPYTANISMIGNGLFLPGAVIYVDPTSVGFGDPRNKRSAASRLGIGGYYIVLSVNTTLQGGTMSTSLSTEYLSWADEESKLFSPLSSQVESSPNVSPEPSETFSASEEDPPYESEVYADSEDPYDIIRQTTQLTSAESQYIIESELSSTFEANDEVTIDVDNAGNRIYHVQKQDGSVVTVRKKGTGGYSIRTR